jgi:hypothetical protein
MNPEPLPDVELTMQAPDGTTRMQTVPWKELVPAALAPTKPFVVDGEAAHQAARIFTGTTATLTGADGLDVHVQRDGRRLRRDDQPVTVVWDEDFTELVVDADGERSRLALGGMALASERADVLAHLAAGFLGAELEPAADLEPQYLGVAILVTLGVSYGACITGGQLLCAQTARQTCRNGVSEFAVVCGAGTDVDGRFQIGFKCSFHCK